MRIKIRKISKEIKAAENLIHIKKELEMLLQQKKIDIKVIAKTKLQIKNLFSLSKIFKIY